MAVSQIMEKWLLKEWLNVIFMPVVLIKDLKCRKLNQSLGLKKCIV